MAARAIDLERIDRFLGTERQIDDAMERLRDLWCDLVWAGDALHEETDLLAKHAPRGFVLNLPARRGDWQSVGGQAAIDAFDNLADEILRLAEESRR